MRRWLWVMALGLAVVALGAWAWYHFGRPALPAVDLEGADPEVGRAVRQARREVEQRPRDAAACGKLGMLLLAHGFRPEAIACLERAEAFDPNDPRWPLYQAVARTDDQRAATDCLRRAAGRAPADDPVPRLLLAAALLEQGDPDGAESALGAPPMADRLRGRYLLTQARVELARDRPARAEAVLKSELAEWPEGGVRKAAWSLLAEAYLRLGRAKEAAQARERAAKLPADPSPPEPHLDELFALLVGKQNRLQRLQHLRATGRLDEARELARAIEQEHPDVYWLIEARILSGQGNVQGAADAYRKAIDHDPASAEARLELARLLADQGRPEDAAVELRLLVKREPTHGPALLLLGRCLRKAGDGPGAVAALRRAVAAVPSSAEAQRDLGAALLDAGEMADAVRHLENSVRLAPGDARARTLLEQARKKQ